MADPASRIRNVETKASQTNWKPANSAPQRSQASTDEIYANEAYADKLTGSFLQDERQNKSSSASSETEREPEREPTKRRLRLPPQESASWKQAAEGFFNNYKDVVEESGNIQNTIKNPPTPPEFPLLMVIIAVAKDALDFFDFSLLLIPITTFLSFILGVVIFFWIFGKVSGGWWKKKMIGWLWKRYILAMLIEFIPFFKVIPATTILILMAHYRETKLVKVINFALEEIKKANVLDLASRK